MNKININKATQAELESLPHVGPKRALAIIADRPFRDKFELSRIKGLGKIRMDSLINEVET